MIKNFTYYKHDENELGHIKGTPTRQEHLCENINQALKRIDNKLSLYDNHTTGFFTLRMEKVIYGTIGYEICPL